MIVIIFSPNYRVHTLQYNIVSDKATLHLLTALQSIVLQTPTDKAPLMEQVKFTKMTVDGLWTRHVIVHITLALCNIMT